MTETIAVPKCRSNLPRKGMSPCKNNERSDITLPFYSLSDVDCPAGPKSIRRLRRLLAGWARTTNGKWNGKLYVAKSICWDPEKREFLQSGCSPNYLAGLWTLTCCKHDMRAAERFKKAVKGDRPVMIFTLSQVSREYHRQFLVSVAMVTNSKCDSFETMEEYARFLLKRRNKTLLQEKLSGLPRSDSGFGWRFGDCHADPNYKVKAPGKDHVHAGPKADRDLDESHFLLASDRFRVWSRPTLWARKIWGPARYGIGVTPDELHKMFVER